MTNDDRRQCLLFGGAVLVLVGLVAGAAIPLMSTARLGLSAHVAGVQGGMLVVIVGLAWNNLKLSPSLASVTFHGTLFSNYVLYAGLQLAALWGASRSMPIAGVGTSGTATQETVVELLLLAGAVGALVSMGLFAWGLVPGRGEQPPINED